MSHRAYICTWPRVGFPPLYCTNNIERLVETWRREIELYGGRGDVARRTKDETCRFICLVFLRGIRERASDTWYPYRHHDLIEAKQSDETNKREGMRAPFPLAFVVSPLPYSASSRLHRDASGTPPVTTNPRPSP